MELEADKRSRAEGRVKSGIWMWRSRLLVGGERDVGRWKWRSYTPLQVPQPQLAFLDPAHFHIHHCSFPVLLPPSLPPFLLSLFFSPFLTCAVFCKLSVPCTNLICIISCKHLHAGNTKVDICLSSTAVHAVAKEFTFWSNKHKR